MYRLINTGVSIKMRIVKHVDTGHSDVSQDAPNDRPRRGVQVTKLQRDKVELVQFHQIPVGGFGQLEIDHH